MVFVVLFAVEAGIKMIALGLTGSEIAYFRDAWNWLDFIIVVEGIITRSVCQGQLLWHPLTSLHFCSVAGNSSSGLSGLRTFRVLRPLRTVSRLRGLRVLVQAMLSSLPLLCNTLVMCCFYFFIFGIIAVQVSVYPSATWKATAMEWPFQLSPCCSFGKVCSTTVASIPTQ